MQAGPLAIKPLPLPKGAQVSIGLPIEAMKDIRTKKHSWNVIQKQYSKYNENNTLEATPEGTCMCVKYPSGAASDYVAAKVLCLPMVVECLCLEKMYKCGGHRKLALHPCCWEHVDPRLCGFACTLVLYACVGFRW